MTRRTQPRREACQPHTLKCRVCGSANVTATGGRNDLGRETHHCEDCSAQFLTNQGTRG
jgi:hypothetical protein